MFDINTHSIMLGFLLSRMWFVKIHGIDISIGNYEQKTKNQQVKKTTATRERKKREKEQGGTQKFPLLHARNQYLKSLELTVIWGEKAIIKTHGYNASTLLQLLQLVYGSSSIKARVNSDRRKKISQAVGKRDAVVEPRTTNKTNPVCGHSRTTRCFPLVTVNARHRVLCNSESDQEGPVKSLTLSSTLSLPWSHFSASPYRLPYNSYDISSESLVLDQLMIPKLIFFFIHITCLHYIVITL